RGRARRPGRPPPRDGPGPEAAVRHPGRGGEHAMNVPGTANLPAAARAEGVRKVVFVSSSGVYGVPTTVPVTEDHPERPLGAYGRSKIEAERLCLDWAGGGGDVTVLRPMSLFGPHMTGVFVLLFDWV